MTRAQEILHLYEVGVGTAAGVVRAGITAARFKQKWDDKVRQAGLGDKLDSARKNRKQTLKKRLANPFSGKRKQAHLQAKKKVSLVKDAGLKKLNKMQKGASNVGRSEMM